MGRRLRRLLARLLALGIVGVLVVLIGLVGLLASILGRAMPETSGTIRLPGLSGPVDVLRDENGFVHIYADTPEDLFAAQGWVHASERMWQMELWRRIGAGRLSELFGEATLDTDRFVRTLGWRRAAERDLAAFSPDVRAALDAYARGVNAWLETHRGRLGIEFVVAGLLTGQGGLGGLEPEPWTPLDSATWQKVQAWSLGGNFESELFRWLADARLGDPARTDSLIPPYPADGPIIVEPGAGAGGAPAAGGGAPVGRGPTAVARGDAAVGRGGSAVARGDAAARPEAVPATKGALRPDWEAAWRDLATAGRTALALAGLDAGAGLASDRGIGSNNWVVAPSKSASGGALLANDPHLGVGMPSVWFVNGLHCRVVSAACPYDVVGVTFPGTPAVVLGTNGTIAWGATNADPDVQDLYEERLDPTDPSRYLFGRESRPLTIRTETIAVAGGEPVTLRVRETHHGPILNDAEPRLRDAPPMALAWTAIAGPDRTLEAFLRLDTARSFDEFRAALSVYGAPAQNFVYADAAGHIGYLMPGWVPIRQAADDLGDRPRPGWDAAHEWLDRIPADALPRLFDPPTGWIVTANNQIVGPDYPYLVGREPDIGDRAARAIELLETAATDGVSLDEMAAIQLDDHPRRVERIIPALLDLRPAPATADGQLLLDRVRTWDGRCSVDSLGCAAYMSWEYHVLRAVFDDDLGDVLAREYVGSPFSWHALELLLRAPDDRWWDDRTTPAAERAPEIVAAAFDRAAADLRAVEGQPRRWTWGRLHTVSFRDDAFGTSGIGPLEWLLNRGPYPAPGAAGALNNTYTRFARAYPDPNDPSVRPVGFGRVFEVTNLPSMRLLVDLADPDATRIVTTTGNGGVPFSRQHGNLIGAWLAGRTVPLTVTGPAIEASVVAQLRLVP